MTSFEALCPAVFNSMPEHIAVVNGSGDIKFVNAAWNAYCDKASGGANSVDWTQWNYLQACDTAAASGDPDARTVSQGLRMVMEGHSERFRHEYPCHSPIRDEWYEVRIFPVRTSGGIYASPQLPLSLIHI